MNTSAILYLGSRGLAAVGNLLAVAIFTRIVGPEEYGRYVLIFAWSMIVYGFSAQWMRFAYFGTYQSSRLNEYVASLAQLHLAALAMLCVGFAAMALYGTFDAEFLLAIFALVFGMIIYESVFEVTRTVPNPTAGALSMIMRTSLIVVFGSALLWCGGGAIGLAYAIAAAHLLAAVPCLMTFSSVRLSQSSRSACVGMLKYGWPLLLSFGVTAIGQSIDRLLLAHFLGTAILGPYGVTADLMRQSFSVVGEAIILALGTQAKLHANEGNIAAADRELRKSFNACLAAACFGAAFFFVFGDAVVQVLLGARFADESRELIPIFAVAFAFMTMRNFYFGQVIYFSGSSYLELVMSILFVIISSVLSIVLIPKYGAYGAAVSLTVAFSASCIMCMVLGRYHYPMPIDLVGLRSIAMLVIGFVALAWLIDQVVTQPRIALLIKGVLFVSAAVIMTRKFGLLRSAEVIAVGPAGKVDTRPRAVVAE